MPNNNSIFIRKAIFEDAECILEWENNEENWRVSDNDSPYSIYDILVLIGELQDIQKVKQGRWMICLSETQEKIGCVDLTTIDFVKKTAEVGILIADKKNRRKGYALKSLICLEKKAVELGLTKLKCRIHSANTASVELFKKCDYQQLNKVENGICFFEKWLKK